MDATGVDRAILVPPTFAGDDNSLSLEAARRYPDRFAVMGQMSLSGASADDVKRWRDQPGMLGVRLTFSRSTSARLLEGDQLEWFWLAAEQEQLPVYVLSPDSTAEIRRIATAHPRLRIIIDHLNIRTGLKDDAILPAVESVIGLADVENVAVKATCLPSYTSQEYPYTDMQRVLRRVVNAFGAQRVFWGSDLSRLPGTYGQAKDLFMKELDFVSEGDLDWIMGRGLSQWLNWP
jgi:L-fuconolactonase